MTGWWSSSTDPLPVPGGGTVRGLAVPPPSKSLTHRALAIALVAREVVVVERPLEAEDSALFVEVLSRLGYGVERHPGRLVVAPPSAFPARAELDCGNAGTLFRFLVALAATLPVRSRIDGTPRLRERPVGPLVAALRALGVRIEELGAPGCAPLVVHGGRLAGGRVRLDASESSQYLSALLLAGQRADGPLEIEVAALASAPYVALTLDLLERMGGDAREVAAGRYRTRPSRLRGGTIAIETDLSAAAYPAAAAALTGGTIRIVGVRRDSLQGDLGILDRLREMGARIAWAEDGVDVSGGELVAIDTDLGALPDQVPTLAALAPFARGTTRIRNVAHLRIKESDRLAAMTAELRRVGATVDELADGLVIPGVWADRPAPTTREVVDPHDDHRIAMAMALVGLRRPGIAVASPGCVAKSYPDFWSDLASWLGERA
ncbi:MAG: 3-phosphoshikimate 1-carboxyvinyltransferase [Thermoanaerobaculia bacterium]